MGRERLNTSVTEALTHRVIDSKSKKLSRKATVYTICHHH